MRLAFALVALTACGRLAFDAERQATDSGGARPDGSHPGDGGAPGDGAPADGAADAPPTCAAWSAFGAPTVLPAVLQSATDDWFGTPTLGGLAIFFDSYRGTSSGDLYVATRATLADPFSTPVALAEVNSVTEDDQSPTLTADGLELFYNVGTAAAPTVDVARRNAADQPFAAPVPVAELVGDGNYEITPWIDAAGLRIVFASERSGSLGLTDLYEATRPTRAQAFGSPVPLSSLDSTGADEAPTLSSDHLEIFFASSRTGGPGGFDIYTARRTAVGQPFGSPSLVSELSSAGDDYGLRLSDDGTTLYLDFNTRVSGGGNADLYTASRTCL